MGIKGESGFLLIEIGIVAALLLIIIALAVPHVTFLRRSCVAVEIDKLAHFFNFCSQKAVITGKSHTLLFDTRLGSYSCGNFHERLTSGVSFGVLPGVYGPPSDPKKPINNPVTFDNQQIIFYPDGSMQSGTIYVRDQEGSCLYALTTPISAIAYMRKYRYSNKRWSLLN